MSETETIIEKLNGRERFTVMSASLRAARLDAVLSGKGPFTLCAPTNEAFNRLPAGELDRLMREPEGKLKRLLNYHIFFGKLVARDLKKLNFPKTRLGTTVEIAEHDGIITINGTTLAIPDISCANGVIHGVEEIICPKSR